MEADRRQRLEALPGWAWDVLLDQWEEGFAYLQVFSEREGHCRVPATYKTEGDYSLGRWVVRQRENDRSMNVDRRQRLEALPGWSWDPLLEQWEEGFSQLKQFSEREAHCRVPRHYKTGDGYPLGNWVHSRRNAKDEMDADLQQRLLTLP